MKFLTPITALAALASAASVDVNKRATPLEVTLEKVGNTKVIAKVTNTGAKGLNLFNKGTILDSQPVEKLVVHSASKSPDFSLQQIQKGTL
jgi:deuterolysin